MANRVLGKNVIVELLLSGTYYPFFCGKTAEFSQDQELIEVTSVNSSVSREYTPGMRTASLSIGGVTILDNTENRISLPYLMNVMGTVKTMRITLTDDDATSIAITFSALITNNTLSRSFGSYSQSSTSLKVTGDIVVTTVDPPPGIVCFEPPLYLDCTPGATNISDPLLDNDDAVIIEVCRSGFQFDEVAGTPGNRQFQFVPATGTIYFDSTNPFNAGEVIYVLYKIQP